MELPSQDTRPSSPEPDLENEVSHLSEELHLLNQHVDDQSALQRETFLRLMSEMKADLLERMDGKFEAARRETEVKLADLRKDIDHKFMWMLAGLVGVIAGQVALFFR